MMVNAGCCPASKRPLARDRDMPRSAPATIFNTCATIFPMKRSELIAMMRAAGARGPISGPEQAWILPSVTVDRLAADIDKPEELRSGFRKADDLNVDAAVLHGAFSAAELKEVLAQMKALGKR